MTTDMTTAACSLSTKSRPPFPWMKKSLCSFHPHTSLASPASPHHSPYHPLPSPVQIPNTAAIASQGDPKQAAEDDACPHAQSHLPPAPLLGRDLQQLPLPAPVQGPGCVGVGGEDGADGPGGRDRVQRRGPERDAAAPGQLPALRPLHLLRRRQGRLRALPVLLRHQLQHPQPPLRVLLLHAQVLRLPRLPPLSRHRRLSALVWFAS